MTGADETNLEKVVSLNPRAKQMMAELDSAALSHASIVGTGRDTHLDDHTRAMVAIGAAVCFESPTNTFRSLIESARTAGATDEETLGVLLTVAPAAGESRLVAVAPRISKALGYDVDIALEYG